MGLGASDPKMHQAFLQGGDLAEPGLVASFGQPCFGVVGHLLDAAELGGVDAQEPAAAARVFVDAGGAVGAVAVAEGDAAQQEVLLELGPSLP